MIWHVTIQGAFRPIGNFAGLSAEQFEPVRIALRNKQKVLITPELEDNWQDIQNGGSIFGSLNKAYDVVRSQLEPPPTDELVITDPDLTEWLDLGELGHEFAKKLLLQSTQPGSTPQPWVISDDVPSIGTFRAHLYITGRITTGEATPPS